MGKHYDISCPKARDPVYNMGVVTPPSTFHRSIARDFFAWFLLSSAV